MNEVTPAMQQAVGKGAIVWWQNYLRAHPEGGWNDAVMDEFHRAGYPIEQDQRSVQSQRELLRVLDSESPILRYNAYRILNQTYGTHFDLDIAFFAGKYALSFLDPSGHETENENRLKRYWQQRLNPQSSITSSISTPQRADGQRAPSRSATAPPTTQQPLSLGEAARRLREQKKQKDQQ